MTTPAAVVTKHAALADDLHTAVTALAGMRGRDRKGIRETPTTAIESIEKDKKRNQHPPPPQASTPRTTGRRSSSAWSSS